MSWLSKFWQPSEAQKQEVTQLQRKADETSSDVVKAYVTLMAAERQARILREMDSNNHYSESLTQAMRGRLP